MKLDNVQSLRVYQAVKFDNKLSTYFVTEDTIHQRACEIEIIPNVGISLKNKHDHVIVPFPNISAIRLYTEQSKELKEDRIADAAKPAPAQKISKVK